jgi:outer membrane receptor protein involved in Fe transport
VVYTAEFVQKDGANTPIEGLRQLPFFVGTTRTENDSNGGDGSAFINLYGLGANNVLTLINGRRAFSFSDINAIPIAALSRAEIFGGNAYGSDSTGGVVNFLMLNGPGERPYEGAELHVLYGNTTDADAHVRQVYVGGGVTGLDGKVSIAAAGEYYSRANLFARDRKVSATGDVRSLGGANTNSPTYPGRVTIQGAAGTRTLIDQSNNAPAPGSYRKFDLAGAGTDPDRFNFRQFTPTIPAVEKAMYYVTGRYKIFGEGLQLYGDVMYSKAKQDNGLAPSPFTIILDSYGNPNLFVPLMDPRTGQPFGYLTPPTVRNPTTLAEFTKFSNAAQRAIIQNSPFNPFPGRQTFTPSPVPGTPLGGNYVSPTGTLTSLSYRTIQELGNRRSFFDHDYYRYVAGVNGDFNFHDSGFISRLSYDSGFVYERFDEQRTDSGDATRGGIYREIIAGNFNPFIGQFAPVTGVAPIYNAAGVQIGIRPYDNAAAARRASYIGHSFFYERDWLADAKTSMHLFPNLWNGGLDLAAGYEHRETQTRQLPDPVQASGDQLGFPTRLNTKYNQEVDSLFAEMNFPIVVSTMAIPGIRSLEFSGSYRYESFEDKDQYRHVTASFDNNGSPQFGLRYQPWSDLMLRASWRQSVRPPTFDELFTPVIQTFPVIFDPIGGIQPPGGFFLGGNPNLVPEQTDAYSAGIVWTPKFLPGFAVTADWYQLFTQDLILPFEDFVQLVVRQNVSDPAGCNNGVPGITRNPDGSIDCIDALAINAGKRLVQGLEVTASYEIPTERWGKFTFSTSYNHFFTWKTELIAGFGSHNFLGDYSSAFPLAPGGIPFNKAFLRGEWEWRHFDFVATGNYIGDYEDDPTFLALNGDPIGGTDAEPVFAFHRRVTSYITLDMQLSYEFVKPAAEPSPPYSKESKNVMQVGADTSSIWQRMLWGTKLTVGVNNAFDRNPPTVLGALNDNYDTSNYSIRNRFWYVAISKKF